MKRAAEQVRMSAAKLYYCYRPLVERVLKIRRDIIMLCGSYECSYCGEHLVFGTDETLRHAVSHMGEANYLQELHRALELAGFSELAAHQHSQAVSDRLRRLLTLGSG